MRVVSNYATVGQDAQSASIKKINRLVTKNASEMLMTDGIEIYCKETINEHPKPLKETWTWLKNNAQNLKIEDIWKEFCSNKMITVTKKEDKLIKDKGFNSRGSIKERYFDLGIKIITLEKNPEDF